jgi:hypothetical protein
MSEDDPYAAVTPAPPLAVRSDDLKHFHTVARGRITVWVDADD